MLQETSMLCKSWTKTEKIARNMHLADDVFLALVLDRRERAPARKECFALQVNDSTSRFTKWREAFFCQKPGDHTLGNLWGTKRTDVTIHNQFFIQEHQGYQNSASQIVIHWGAISSSFQDFIHELINCDWRPTRVGGWLTWFPWLVIHPPLVGYLVVHNHWQHPLFLTIWSRR